MLIFGIQMLPTSPSQAIRGCLVVSPPMFRMRPANGKPV